MLIKSEKDWEKEKLIDASNIAPMTISLGEDSESSSDEESDFYEHLNEI